MNKEFIPYEQALELKELGFDEKCFGYYVLLATNKIELVLEETSKEFYKAIADSIEDTKRIPEDFYTLAPLYQQAFRWLRNQYMTKSYINEKRDYIEGNFFNLPLISPNGYEIKLLEQSTSYTIVGGREIPFYAEPEAVYKETTESYESAEIACLKKLIEVIKNK